MKICDQSINHCLSNKVNAKIQKLEKKEERILCNHCLRTASNGIRCMGVCVADNDYWIQSIKYAFQLLIIIFSTLF